MKRSFKLGSMLLATTMLVSPIAANAQETTVAIPEPAADQIVVRGRNIPEPQRATAQVASFLSAEDLDRTGDTNAALALTRLSGLSVVSGKFAYVRGLGDRYSAARLNGSVLPSPEPLKRTVPLDLFPSNVLGGAIVQKSYSVNYPGEFGGGMIDLSTKADPGEDFLDVKFGIGMNTVTTGHEGLFVNGGGRDWLGYDDGTGDIPGPIQSLFDSQTSLSDLSDSEREAVGESLVNSPLSVIQNGTLGPNYDASIEGGLSRDVFSDGVFGFVGVVGYSQDWATEESVRQFVARDEVGLDFETTETSLTATTNGMGTFALTFPEHEVKATLLYIHSARKEAQIDKGEDFNALGSRMVLDQSSSWLERQLSMAQLTGEHLFGDFEVNWRGALARSKRNSPYERSLRLNESGGSYIYNEANNNRISFSDLTDDAVSGGIDLIYNVPVSGAREVIVSAGYEYSKTEREANVHNFRFIGGGSSLPADVQMARVDYLFSPDNIDPARFVLEETSNTNVESYRGDLLIHAGYFQADMELIPTLRTTLGVRYEDAEQVVETYDRFPGNDLLRPVTPSVIANDYWLPSAMVTWNFADNMQFRVGYSQTIARPQLRELAPSEFLDPESDRTYRGNKFLVDSKFQNFDARFEYYLGRNQFLTLAGFYKEIENPIEEVIFETSTFRFNTTFINAPKAELLGGEFEYRTRFGIDFLNDWFSNREWLFSVNYTFTDSSLVVAEGDELISPFSLFQGSLTTFDASTLGLDGEPLQGTPKHIANAQFGWEDDDEQFTLLFGWVDDRILQRGDRLAQVPDVIEEPGVQLDAVYRQDVVIGGIDFTIGLSARNLLGTQHKEYQLSDADIDGRTEFNTYKRGRSLSASLTAKF